MRFPGSVLLKIGFGKDSIARSTLWIESSRRLEQTEKKRTNEVTQTPTTTTTEEREITAGSSSADEEENEDNCGRYSLSGKKVSHPPASIFTDVTHIRGLHWLVGRPRSSTDDHLFAFVYSQLFSCC